MSFIKTAIVAASIGAFSVFAACATDADRAELARIEASPATDAAFASINKLMMQFSGRAYSQQGGLSADDRAVMKRLGELLLLHHAANRDFANAALVYAFSAPLDEQMEYLRRAYDATPVMETRSGLAASLINMAEMAFHSRATPPARRESIRRTIAGFVAQIRKDFPDNQFRLRHADLSLASLGYSLGDRLPDAQWPLVQGEGTAKVADHRGRILIVDIWATWCSPCVAGQPGLLAFTEEMKGKPLDVITLSMDKKPEDVVAHQKKQPMPWINAFIGFNAPILDTIGIGSYPTYFVLDENGVIRARVGEFDDATKDYVRELVEGLGRAAAATR